MPVWLWHWISFKPRTIPFLIYRHLPTFTPNRWLHTLCLSDRNGRQSPRNIPPPGWWVTRASACRREAAYGAGIATSLPSEERLSCHLFTQWQCQLGSWEHLWRAFFLKLVITETNYKFLVNLLQRDHWDDWSRLFSSPEGRPVSCGRERNISELAGEGLRGVGVSPGICLARKFFHPKLISS